MTRQRALELGLLVCSCGHPENNHFDFELQPCAHCKCNEYKEQGRIGIRVRKVKARKKQA